MLPAAVFLLVAFFTALYLPLGQRLQHLDQPNARSAHRQPTLSSGGVAVIGGLLLVLGAGIFLELLVLGVRERWALCFIGLFSLVGLVDDRRPLPVALRLSVFLLLSAATAWLYLPGHGVLVLGIVALALCWLVNLYNFMDGIDGIAALQCALVAAGLAGLGWLGGAPTSFVVVALAAAAAYGAFLCFNWPPARLFMGDAGSLSAGYMLGWLGLWGTVDGYLCALCWCLLMSPFLIDTGVTLALRMGRGERITEAHSTHAYQRLARHFGSHRRVDLGLLLLQLCWLFPLALAHQLEWLAGTTCIPLALFPQLFLIAKAMRLK